MITPKDIQAAIVVRVEQQFPGEPVYEDLTPRDFARPSNLVALDGLDLDQGPAASTLTILYTFRLTTFSQVDEVHNSHFPVLDFRAMMLMSLFGQGYLQVGDRAPKVRKCTANTKPYDYAEVLVQIAQGYDRSEFESGQAYQIMEDLTLTTKTKEEHT